MLDPRHVARRVKEAIVLSLKLNIDPDEIDDEESLFGGVGADSIATLEIVSALEEEFGIEVDDEDFRVELFDSVLAIRRYVVNKLAEVQSQSQP